MIPPGPLFWKINVFATIQKSPQSHALGGSFFIFPSGEGSGGIFIFS